MKNQPFHQRKIRIQETPALDLLQLKARTTNALGKLGQQKLSAEPGGYAIENWARGVNVLLDEFEEKAGAQRLSPEYLARRQELNELLSHPVPVQSLDREESELSRGVSEIESRIEAERAQIASRLSGLKAEQARCSDELEMERTRAAAAAAEQGANSRLGRLFGRKAQTKRPESRIGELESRLAALPGEVQEQRRLLGLVDSRSPESRFASEWTQLESMQARLEELQKERLDRTQLVKERVEATGAIADAISRIS